MASLTPEAQQLISKAGLGTPTAVYGPGTVLNTIGFLFFAAFGAAWTLLAASITNSPIIPSNLHFFQSEFTPSDTPFQVLQIAFPLFGLLFVLIALVSLVRTFLNRHSRGVACAYGVACITRKHADAVRWEEILTVIHGIDVHTTTTRHQHGGTTTSTTVSHKYTVHCQDGRKILFDKTSCGRKIQDMGETLQVETARRNQGRKSYY
ncbi:MAG TPA: hypothetical protein VH540_22470 [Ktedonobacterales bacterium]|jgi:hypothetical protein